jgi:hypothetical protein
MKVSSEIPDVDIIDYFAPQIREQMMKSIPQEVLSTEEAPAAVSEYGLTKENFEFSEGYDEAMTAEAARAERKAFLENKISKLEQDIENGVADSGTYSDIDAYRKELELQPKYGLTSANFKATVAQVPKYTVNNTLSNADGTKRFAQTNGKQIVLNPATSTQEFFDYFEGKEGGSTSLQKQKVLDSLSKQGWSIERIKSTLSTTKLINTFLILHEQSHIDNNDKDVYWVNGKDLMTNDKIDMETRASIDALNKLSLSEQQEFPDKQLNIKDEKCK